MSFVSDFFLHSLLAALVATILFSLPGLGVLRLLGLMTRKHILAALLVAPALVYLWGFFISFHSTVWLFHLNNHRSMATLSSHCVTMDSAHINKPPAKRVVI